MDFDFIKKINNSLFSNLIQKEEYFLADFSGHYKSKTQKIMIQQIDFLYEFNNDDSLIYNFFIHNVKDSYQYAKELTYEFMPDLNDEDFSRICSCIYNCLYKTTKIKKDIFYFVSNVFVNINVFHFLPNGNKRIAVAILIKLLYNFGYYFKFTDDK